MRKVTLGITAVLTAVLLALSGCGGSDSSSTTGSTPTTATTPTTTAAVANAGNDQSVTTGSTVALDGSASSGASGATMSYAWSFVSKPAGSNAALSSATAANPTFVADVDGTYVVQLVVSDGTTTSTPKQVTVVAAAATTPPTTNVAPVANAGTSRYATTGTTVDLNAGASSDPNGTPVTYAWTLASAPTGSTAALTGATTVNPTFTPDVDGAYVVKLVVSDGSLSSPEASVTITATSPIDLYTAFPADVASIASLTPISVDGALLTTPLADAGVYRFTTGLPPIVFRSADGIGFEQGIGWIGFISGGAGANGGLDWKVAQTGTYRITGSYYVQSNALGNVEMSIRDGGQIFATSVVAGAAPVPFDVTIQASQYDAIAIFALAGAINDTSFIKGTIQLVGP